MGNFYLYLFIKFASENEKGIQLLAVITFVTKFGLEKKKNISTKNDFEK